MHQDPAPVPSLQDPAPRDAGQRRAGEDLDAWLDAIVDGEVAMPHDPLHQEAVCLALVRRALVGNASRAAAADVAAEPPIPGEASEVAA